MAKKGFVIIEIKLSGILETDTCNSSVSNGNKTGKSSIKFNLRNRFHFAVRLFSVDHR